MHYLKQYYRNLTKNGVFSILNLMGFGVGIAVSLIIVLYTKHEYSYNTDYTDHRQIYRVFDSTDMNEAVDYNLNELLTDKYPEILLATPINMYGENWQVEVRWKHHPPVKLKFASTTNPFFEIFKPIIVQGNSLSPLPDYNSVVLTESAAKKIFGDTDPIGQKIVLRHEFTLEVTAIIGDFTSNSTLQTDLILNAENEKYRFSTRCHNYDCWNPMGSIVMLAANTQVDKLITTINKDIKTWNVHCEAIGMQKLEDIYLDKTIEGSIHEMGNSNLIRILLLIGMLILVMSMINLIYYRISIQLSGLRNIAIKQVNGASRFNMISDIKVESGLSLLIAYILAILLIYLFNPLIAAILQVPLRMSNLYNIRIILLQIALLVVILFFQSFPIYTLVLKSRTISTLSGKTRIASKQAIKSGLTTLQFIVSVGLIICFIVIYKQIDKVKHAHLGFNKDQLLRVDIPQNYHNAEILKQELLKNPGVVNASLSQGTPGAINMGWGTNHEAGKSILAACIPCDKNFVETFDIEIIHERGFFDSDMGIACLINEAAFKAFEWTNFEGKKINNARPGGINIVGVVKDFHVQSFHNEIEPTIIFFNPSMQARQLNVKIHPSSIAQVLEQIKSFWQEFTPDYILEYQFYDAWFGTMYQKEENTARSIGFFTIIALLITCLGILGQAHQMSYLRIKEIGIRKVNGAKVYEILNLLNKGLVKRILLAFLIACPITWYLMNKWLDNFAYKIDLQWWIFALGALVALFLALITISWHSWRAASRNPEEALRYE